MFEHNGGVNLLDFRIHIVLEALNLLEHLFVARPIEVFVDIDGREVEVAQEALQVNLFGRMLDDKVFLAREDIYLDFGREVDVARDNQRVGALLLLERVAIAP